MTKHCPILILTSVIGRTFGNVGSCYVVMGDKCIKESCALWNEAQGRCGLACTSQSKHAPISSVADKQHSGILEE